MSNSQGNRNFNPESNNAGLCQIPNHGTTHILLPPGKVGQILNTTAEFWVVTVTARQRPDGSIPGSSGSGALLVMAPAVALNPILPHPINDPHEVSSMTSQSPPHLPAVTRIAMNNSSTSSSPALALLQAELEEVKTRVSRLEKEKAILKASLDLEKSLGIWDNHSLLPGTPDLSPTGNRDQPGGCFTGNAMEEETGVGICPAQEVGPGSFTIEQSEQESPEWWNQSGDIDTFWN